MLSQTAGWRRANTYIAVNPNASDLLLERRWPDEYVVETVGQLVSLGHQVALVGAKNERTYVQSLVDRLPADARLHVANTAGRLTLGELLALLEGAACVLTNDSGPMHMAVRSIQDAGRFVFSGRPAASIMVRTFPTSRFSMNQVFIVHAAL